MGLSFTSGPRVEPTGIVLDVVFDIILVLYYVNELFVPLAW